MFSIFFFLHFGLRETESGFEKHILYTRNYYKLGDYYTVVKDLFLFSLLHTVSWFLSLDYRHEVIEIYQYTLKNKGNNKITELRTILQRESQNS